MYPTEDSAVMYNRKGTVGVLLRVTLPLYEMLTLSLGARDDSQWRTTPGYTYVLHKGCVSVGTYLTACNNQLYRTTSGKTLLNL